MDDYDRRNCRLDFRCSENFLRDFRPEAHGFFRALGLSHLIEEVWDPLLSQSRTLAVVAIDERPWPPQGVGARAIHGLAQAVLSDDGQAIATPAMLHPSDVSNVGLAASLTKYLLEELRDAGVDYVSYFADPASRLITTLLDEAGFVAGGARIVFGGSEFVNFSTSPNALLDRLGLTDVRLADVLSLRVEPRRLTQWTAFHLGLEAGLRPYWDDRIAMARVFPGIVDWVSLPPAMITGTPGPGPRDREPIETRPG